jgi:hypothetical protein
MRVDRLLPAERRERAHEALVALGSPRSTHRRMEVNCRRSHHVAAVYVASDGRLVYVATVGLHPHGSRDRQETGHAGDSRGRTFVDYLDLGGNDLAGDDALPAACECGPRTLSRSELLAAMADGARHRIIT